MKPGWLLIGNKLLMYALQVPWMDLVLRAIRAAVRQGDNRPRAMLRAAWSPTLGVATGLVLAQRIGHPYLMRAFYRRVSNNQR